MTEHERWCPAVNAAMAKRYGGHHCACGHGLNLPDGQACGGCAHYTYCVRLFDRHAESERCDWSPSRFVPRPPTIVISPADVVRLAAQPSRHNEEEDADVA